MIQKAKLLGMAPLGYLEQPTQQWMLQFLCYQTPAQPVSWSRALAAVSLRSHKGKAEKEREA